jgi:hypothetical protein
VGQAGRGVRESGGKRREAAGKPALRGWIRHGKGLLLGNVVYYSYSRAQNPGKRDKL